MLELRRLPKLLMENDPTMVLATAKSHISLHVMLSYHRLSILYFSEHLHQTPSTLGISKKGKIHHENLIIMYLFFFLPGRSCHVSQKDKLYVRHPRSAYVSGGHCLPLAFV